MVAGEVILEPKINKLAKLIDIFDEMSKKVVGKQNNDGTMAVLTVGDIESCKEYNFEYEIPSTIPDDKPYDDDIMYE